MNNSIYNTLLGSICLISTFMLGLLAYEYETIGRGLNPVIAIIAAFVIQLVWFYGANLFEGNSHE